MVVGMGVRGIERVFAFCFLLFAFCFLLFAFCFLFLLASALCFRSASVAPVRGGTYFLCRRKESKQRKRAHTASTCFYPRARDVPMLHAVTSSFALVADALFVRLTLFTHLHVG
jgi:hypothetical protein